MPMEEASPTLMTDREEPPKKGEAAADAAAEVALIAPLEDASLAQVVEEAPKKVEAIETVEEEAPKKVVASGQQEEEEEEEMGLNGTGGAFWSQEVKNNETQGDGGADKGTDVEEVEEGSKGRSTGAVEEPMLRDTEATICLVELTLTLPLESNDTEDTEDAIEVVDHEKKVDDDCIIEAVTNVIDVENNKVEGDRGGDDGGELEVVEEDAKARTLDVEEDEKDDGRRELMARDVVVVVPVVEPAPVVESKSKSDELKEEDAAISSPDAVEGKDKGELWKEPEEDVATAVEAKVAGKVADDVNAATIEEKLEPEGEKGEETDYGGGDGGELGEEKEVEVSAIGVGATKLEDKVALFVESNGEFSCQKEASYELIVGGEEVPEESTKKVDDVEDEVAKSELTSEVVHGGNVDEVYLESTHNVLEDSLGKEQNFEGQTNASEFVQEIGVKKPLEVENVIIAVEDFGFEKPTEIKNVPIEVEGIDVENPMEIEKFVSYSVDGVMSREVEPESSKENKNVEETERATEVVDHEEEIDDDDIIEAMKNVVDAEKDEAKSDGGGDDGWVLEEVEEDAKVGSLDVVVTMKYDGGMEQVEQDTEVVISVVELAPAQALEPKLESEELRQVEDAMAFPDASSEGGDKCELREEQEEKVNAMVEAKITDNVIDDVKPIVLEEEKQEPPSLKDEELGYGDGDGGKLGKEKEVEVSAISVEVAELEHKVDLFAKTYGKLGYDKEESNEIVMVEGEEDQEESIQKYVDVEDKVGKPDQASKATIVVVHDGSIEKVDLGSPDSVLEDSLEKEKNVEGQENASKAVENVGVEKPLDVEVATVVEDVGVEKLREIENVDVVQDIDVKKPIEVENVVASSYTGILSQELEPESSKENNDAKDLKGATKVFDHEQGVHDEDMIEIVTNVIDAKIDEAEVDRRRDDSSVVEEAKEEAKDKSLDVAMAMKDDGGTEPTVLDTEVVVSMVELVLVPIVESKSEHNELGEGEEEDAIASPNAPEGEDKDELLEEEKVGIVVETKVANKVVDDAKNAAAEEEKLELEGEKGEKVGYKGRDGGELGKEKEAEVSGITIETTKPKDNISPFVEANNEFDYEKEQSEYIVAMGGEAAVEESIEKDVDVEVEAIKPELVRDTSTMIVHDISIEVVDRTSVDRVLKDNTGKEQNVEGQSFASEEVQDVSVEKLLEVESVATRVEDIGIKKSMEVENVSAEVEGLDVKKSMEVENIVASSADDILSQELAPKSSKENNDAEKTKGGTEVVDYEEEVDNDGIIEALTNITDTENDEVECDGGGDDDGYVQDAKGETKDGSLDAAETVKDNGSKEPMTQDVEFAISVVEPTLALVVECEAENSELGEDAAMAFSNALEGEHQGEFWEEREEGEVGVVVEAKIMDKAEDDAKAAMAEKEKPELDKKGDEVGYGGSELSEEKESMVCVVPVEVAELEDKVALLSEGKGDLDYIKEASDDTMVVGDEIASEELTEKDVSVEDEDVKPRPSSKASIEVMHDGSVVEVNPESAECLLEDSLNKEPNVEGMATASEALEDVGVEKPLGDENIVVAEDIYVEKPIEVENVVSIEGIDVQKLLKVKNVVISSDDGILSQELAPESSMENNDSGEMGEATKVDDHEDEVNDNDIIKAVIDNENGVANKADKDEGGANSNTSGSSYGNITFSSQDDSRILIMDQPTELGSSEYSLWPTAQPNLLNTSELALTINHTEEMTEEDKKLHDKVELIRVKFLRLVYRLGATVDETVAAQVMYRLSLAESNRWQMNQCFSFDNAQKKALILEAEGKEDLNFSCNILVLGKNGVGKSATINSIFGAEKSKTDAFSSATTSVREIVGDVHGVKIRIFDTPGLQPNVMDQASNRKILVAVKKYTKKCPPDIVLYVDRLDCLSRDLNDLPLLKTITAILGPSIWFNAIVALTHAASPPEGLNGTPMPYEVLMAHSSHIVQQSIRQATRDMRLMNPVALVENHPSCRQNSESQKVLPNDQSWRPQILLLCYSAKILSEANSLLMLQDTNPEKLFGFHFHSLPHHFLLSSLLQSRGNIAVENDQDPPPKNVSVPLPDMVLPPSFDCDNPTYRYRFLETTSTVLARPILDAHGWDHDCGYDGISMEDTLAILNRFPGNVEVQVTKNKKEFSIHLDSSIAAQHGENASSLAGFDIHTVGQQLAYIIHGETKIKNIKKNKTTGGFLVTFLGDIVATGLKLEDQISLGKRLSLVASTGAMRAQGDTAYGANLEARLKDKDYPIGQSLSTLGLSLMKWRQDLALGANLQSQFSIGRGSKMALRLGLNINLNEQITVKTSTSEHVQIALLGLVPVAASIYRSFRPSEP